MKMTVTCLKQLKVALCAILLTMLAACSTGTAYKIVGDQPRAAVFFTSPYLEDRFLSIDSLSLDLVEIDAECKVRILGAIPLSKTIGDAGQRVEVAAEKRLYLKLSQENDEFLGTHSVRQHIFRFIPATGKEYVVEHIDNPSPARLRFRVYRQVTATNTTEVETENVTNCE